MLPGHTQHSFPHTLCKFCNGCIFPSDGSYILSWYFQHCVMLPAVWCCWGVYSWKLDDYVTVIMLLDDYVTVDFTETSEQCSEMYTLNIVVKYLVFISVRHRFAATLYSFQQSSWNQKGSTSYADVRWFNLYLSALICTRWIQSGSKHSEKLVPGGTSFWGSTLRPLNSQQWSVVLSVSWNLSG